MAYDPSIFNINPYYDDFDGDKGFLRVLFKPGYALQARELTQIQSILQDQVSKLGNHLFKDGSRIVGGGISVRNTNYILVGVGSGTPLEGVTDYDGLVGGVLTDSSGNSVRVVHYLEPDPNTDGYLILVVDFISGSTLIGTMTFERDDLTITGIVAQQIPVSGLTTEVCKLVTVSDGIFYVDGFFVRVSTQHFSPFNATTYRDLSFFGSEGSFSALSKKIGFYINRDSITEQEDSTLRDPSIGSYNYNAPGADRYKITLSLGQAELNETPDDFVELLRFENGKITKKIDRVTYGDILNALARRTFDESGSYTVKPFDIVIKQNKTDSEQFNVSVSGGKAYVLGYEVENQHPITIPISKARDTQTETDAKFTQFSVGNKVEVVLSSPENFGSTFAEYASLIGNGSAVIRFFDSTENVVADGYVHGAIPNPRDLNVPETCRHGYEYTMYLYGISGNVSSGVSGAIYLPNNTIVAAFSPAGQSTNFSTTMTDDSSLVYELQPGYALNQIQSLNMVTKIVGDITPNTLTITGLANNITRYSFGKSHFSDTIKNAGESFRFFNYGTSSNPRTNTDDLQDISFIIASGNDSSLNMLVHGGGSRIYNNSDGSISVEVPSAQAEFNGGSLRAVCPIQYSPNVSNLSTYRYKETQEVLEAPLGAVQVEQTNEENERRYYWLRRPVGSTFERVPDVYSIIRVVDQNGVDYTNDFELDDGQKEAYYDYSKLYVKKHLSSETRHSDTGQLEYEVSYRYFRHSGLQCAPFLGRHSYDHSTGIPYDQIPLYTNPKTGKTVSLAKCLDFRRSTPDSSTLMIKPYGMAEFGLGNDTVISYSHYLPRVDKLCVKSDSEDGSPLFSVVSGTPDLAPVAPLDPNDSLVIATLTIPSYTHKPSDVVVTPVENKRYTMRDIGNIEKRIDEVEVFAKLSLSELEAESKSLRGSTAEREPLKTSIFSDEFYGHSVADVTDSLYSCSIDYERGELRPFYTESHIQMPSPNLSRVVVTDDGVAMLEYRELPYVENSKYTKTVSVNPSNAVNWLGFMKLSRAIEPFYDLGYRPIIKTNALMENDNWISANTRSANGFGTQWNSWESLWTGIEQVEDEQDDIQKRIVQVPYSNSVSAVQSYNSGNSNIGTSRTVESVDQKTSKFIRARHLKNRIKYNIESRMVDRSVVPYVPARSNVTATVHGLKPNSQNLTLYVDGETVKSGITTDIHGSAVVAFGISAGTFLAGSRIVRISDKPIEDAENCIMAADAVYHCNGLIQQRDSGSFSTRSPDFRRQTVNSEAIAKDPFNRDIDSVKNSHWSDPLSQTFFVDKKTNPDGVFISSVSLYFSEKDSVLPVTVQIRPTVGGYPSPSVCLPFSTVTLMPEQINADTSPVATVFTFSTPVYLEPGEWAICILANSENYKVYAAQTALNTLANSDATSGRAGNNQLVGTLYSPQGFGPAVQDNDTDLMFSLNYCNFDESANGSIVWEGVQNCTGRQIIKIYAPEIVPSSTQINRNIVGRNSHNNNEKIYLEPPLSSAPQIQYQLIRGDNVSPVVDLQAMYAASVQMFQDTDQNNAKSSRYVSRVIDLPEELVSNGIAVFLDAYLPTETKVEVYCRYSINGESDVFTKPWVKIPLMPPYAGDSDTPFVSVSEIDFRKAYYKIGGGSIENFKSYQIRVDLKSTSVNTPAYKQTPAVRNVKAVSFVGEETTI